MFNQDIMDNIELFILADIAFVALSLSHWNRDVFFKVRNLYFFFIRLEIALVDLNS